MDYAKIYEQWQKNPDDGFFHVTVQWAGNAKYGPLMQADLERAYFALYPKRRTVTEKKLLADLPADEFERIKQKWSALALAWALKKMRQKELLSALLSKHAPDAPMTPQETEVDLYSANSSTYGSQGWGAEKYASADAEMKADLLREAGFTVRIETKVDRFEITPTPWNSWRSTGSVTYYTVWANAAPWQLEALKRRRTLDDIRRQCRKHQVNEHVYNPFLPHED